MSSSSNDNQGTPKVPQINNQQNTDQQFQQSLSQFYSSTRTNTCVLTPPPIRPIARPIFATPTSQTRSQNQAQQVSSSKTSASKKVKSEDVFPQYSKSFLDEESIEIYDGGRYMRSTELIGKGRFKYVYRGFDAKGGQDIAWSKINLQAQKLNSQEADNLLKEMVKGIALDHSNIIKCHQCWLDQEVGEINLITERFTSGSLRQYRKMFESVERNVIRKYARQLLKGLEYLHSQTPPIVHGDLRCDKIYVNGFSGELKIGDLGLATLLPNRLVNGSYNLQVQPIVDIKALGLCILELCTNVKFDLSYLENGKSVNEYISQVTDIEANTFIKLCLKQDFVRGQNIATELLQHPFVKRKYSNGGFKNGVTSNGIRLEPTGLAHQLSKLQSTKMNCDGDELLLVGDLRGEDYRFQFEGRSCCEQSGKIHFTIRMYVENDNMDTTSKQQKGRSLEFEFDPDVDTVDRVVHEMQDQFCLSDTDANLCAAAMRESLAREFPDFHHWDVD